MQLWEEDDKEFEEDKYDEEWSDIDEYQSIYQTLNSNNESTKTLNKTWKCPKCNNVNSLAQYYYILTIYFKTKQIIFNFK